MSGDARGAGLGFPTANLAVPPGASARVGDRLAIVPNHVCPAINLASVVTVAEGGRLADRWPVAARGMVR